MKKDRDMMYYGMSGYQQGPLPMMPYQNIPNQNYTQQNDLENRLQRIERQIRKLDSRINRLENPYPDLQNYQSNNLDQPFKNDNSMYMM